MLAKLHSQMRAMETHKYLDPKSSQTFEELVHFLKKKQVKEASMFNNCNINVKDNNNMNKIYSSDVESIHLSEFEQGKHPYVNLNNIKQKVYYDQEKEK